MAEVEMEREAVRLILRVFEEGGVFTTGLKFEQLEQNTVSTHPHSCQQLCELATFGGPDRPLTPQGHRTGIPDPVRRQVQSGVPLLADWNQTLSLPQFHREQQS